MHSLNDPVDKNIVDVSKRRSASAKAVREFRTRINSVGTTKVAYELELLKGFARNQVNSAYVMPVLIALVAVISIAWIDVIVAGIWATVTIAAHLVLCYLSKRFIDCDEEHQGVDVWRRRFVIAQFLIAAAWTFYAFTSCQGCTGNEYAIIQFSTILVFVTATSMLYHALGLSSLIAVLPPTLTMAGKLSWTMEVPLLVMAGILITSLVFSHLLARRFQSLLISMLEHSTVKETLIAELETEKSFSEGARQRAEEANLAKSRFLATMSHELRTPLNAILGFSEIMRDEVFGQLGNDQYREYVNDIHNSGSHLLKLINEILDISRIEAGKHEINEEYLNLATVVDDARHMMEIKAKQKDIKIVTAYEYGLPDVWVDERAIRQVTLNLLSNAMKFTPTGGEICIKVGWTSKGGQYFSVKDSGPGIPEEEIPIVLSSFGQGTIAIKHAEPGTGLGLSIVQALLQIHQGRFDLKSKLREGTEAIAYLPASRVSKKRSSPPALDDDILEDELSKKFA